MEIKLRVAGIGYDGASAGTGGAEFLAQDIGEDRDAVYYRKPQGRGLQSAFRQFFGGKEVGKAYLNIQDRGALDNASVVYKTRDEVSKTAASDYVLWLAE